MRGRKPTDYGHVSLLLAIRLVATHYSSYFSCAGRHFMFLDEFHSVTDGRIGISADQASHFAKRVAGDYNPIHNPDARRFCVPGDLLFSLVLRRFGLSQRMNFRFLSMVGADVPLNLEEHADGWIRV